jgi:hypothetical protein
MTIDPPMPTPFEKNKNMVFNAREPLEFRSVMDALDFYTFAAIVATLAVAWYVWRL